MAYAELCTLSNFTFLTGASHPEELVARASELGLSAIAITDCNSFAGIVRAHAAAKKYAIGFRVGVRLLLVDGPDILAYPQTREGYGRVCRLLTLGKMRAPKGLCYLWLDDVRRGLRECSLVLLSEPCVADFSFAASLGENPYACARRYDLHEAALFLKKTFGSNLLLGMAPRYDGNDRRRFASCASLAKRFDLSLVALGDAVMHCAERRPIADLLSCVRLRTTIDQLGYSALMNAERRLKPEFDLRRLFSEYPDALENTLLIAERCAFSLDELVYEYPEEVSEGMEPGGCLRRFVADGLEKRYPNGAPERVREMIRKELAVIDELQYARYFLTVYDLVAFARRRGILCQGRGSAANSVVCYALGITEVSPDQISMVFERFISSARKQPPDIDVDFENERREEVIQYIYEKYGRHRAGLCATVIHFRSRSAYREVGKAMGLSEGWSVFCQEADLSERGRGWGQETGKKGSISVPDSHGSIVAKAFALAQVLIGFPRHLSQHVGGFVITKGRLDTLCPVEKAAMEDRTIIEWDKDDIDLMGMLKVDVLALGMLTALRKSFDLLRLWKGRSDSLDSIPQNDAQVFDMICRADTVGVFQIESRAQMNFLPRMRPRSYYDLVIQIAIIRPGPIQGNMLHPYLKRRNAEEKVTYPGPRLEEVLKKTLGVPIFQEQAMQIAVIAAGFSASEADQLRRALGTFRANGSVERFRTRFISGCLERGFDRSFAEQCFAQLEGFSSYGFPESHSASFALLTYASSWLKCHHPEVFCCALLNSQPMGFYSPAQLVSDARSHGVSVFPPCVEKSFWDHVLEPQPSGDLAIRLGFRQIKGLSVDQMHRLTQKRSEGYGSMRAFCHGSGLSPESLRRLALADACACYNLSRREALWHIKGACGRKMPLFCDGDENENPNEAVVLPTMPQRAEVYEDYLAMRLTLRAHPVSFLRTELGGLSALDLEQSPSGKRVCTSGLVITRQRPGTASGVVFLTLEDETGVVNIVVWKAVFERFRSEVMYGRLLRVRGTFERAGLVSHLIASRIEDLTVLLESFVEGQGTKREEVSSLDRAPVGGMGHPRVQAKRLFASRDFH